MSNQSNNEHQSPQMNQHKAQLCDLFFEIRQKLDSGSQVYLRRVIPLDDDQNTIYNTEYMILLQYIKQIFNYLVVTKKELEQIIEQNSSNECSDYETCLQKLEAEVRQHIRIEQQLKLFAETTQEKLEQVMKEQEEKEDKYKGINLDQIKQIEKNNYKMIDQMQKNEEEILLFKAQLKQKDEQNSQSDQLIQQLKNQIQQIQTQQQQFQQQNHMSNSQWLQSQTSQLQFNSQIVKEDSSLSSQIIPTNAHLHNSQQNLSELSSTEAKRCKRSVSNMNEDKLKKYTQFSHQSQINPQNILSSNIQLPQNALHKLQTVNNNADHLLEDQQNTRTYTEPYMQERCSSQQAIDQETKENRNHFDKQSLSISDKLIKKDGQYSCQSNDNNNKNQLLNSITSSKLNQAYTGILNSKQNSNQSVVQKSQQTSAASSSSNNISSSTVNQKQKPQECSKGISTQGYLQNNLKQSNSQINSNQLYQNSQVQSQSSQQQSLVYGQRVKNYLNPSNNQSNLLSSTNSINGANTPYYQFDGTYQTLDSQRNKLNISNKVNEFQNCLSSRQSSTGLPLSQQNQNIPGVSHLRNSSNQSLTHQNDKSNSLVMNNSYFLQNNQQQPNNSQQISSIQINLANSQQLNSQNLKYSPAIQQFQYQNNSSQQYNCDFNKNPYLNITGNNNSNMNIYNSKDQQSNLNINNININNVSINAQQTNNNASIGNLKNNSLFNSQINSNNVSLNTKYGQYTQSQRPNSSLEKSNPYISNNQQHYKPQTANGVPNIQNAPMYNNNQYTYQHLGSHNPRSQSMDEFSQQNSINKQLTLQQVQNIYQKQKGFSQI